MRDEHPKWRKLSGRATVDAVRAGPNPAAAEGASHYLSTASTGLGHVEPVKLTARTRCRYGRDKFTKPCLKWLCGAVG